MLLFGTLIILEKSVALLGGTKNNIKQGRNIPTHIFIDKNFKDKY